MDLQNKYDGCMKYLSLRNNVIKALNNIKLEQYQNCKKLQMVIDYRGNDIRSMMTVATEEFFEDSTLLLWDNCYEEYDDDRIEAYPYHIYVCNDEDVNYFDRLFE